MRLYGNEYLAMRLYKIVHIRILGNGTVYMYMYMPKMNMGYNNYYVMNENRGL